MSDNLENATSSSNAQRRWYLIVRRTGFATQRIPITLRFVPTSTNLTQYVPQPQVSNDVELALDQQNITDADQVIGVAEVELVCVTQPFEIEEVE